VNMTLLPYNISKKTKGRLKTFSDGLLLYLKTP